LNQGRYKLDDPRISGLRGTIVAEIEYEMYAIKGPVF